MEGRSSNYQEYVATTKNKNASTNKSIKNIKGCVYVAPGFKDKTRYTLYVSPGSQISHIATNKGNIKRQYLLHNVLVKGK